MFTDLCDNFEQFFPNRKAGMTMRGIYNHDEWSDKTNAGARLSFENNQYSQSLMDFSFYSPQYVRATDKIKKKAKKQNIQPES